MQPPEFWILTDDELDTVAAGARLHDIDLGPDVVVPRSRSDQGNPSVRMMPPPGYERGA